MVRPPSVDRNGVKKGAWSEEEDNKLRAYIQRYGHWNWRLLPKYAGLARCGKSCRLRWMNYLKPGVKRGNFSKHEEDLVVELHSQLGNKWSAIAAKLPGRTDNEIKNFWHTRIKKRRKPNPPAKKVKGHTNEASSKAQVLEKEKPSEATLRTTTLKESASSDAALIKLQNSTLPFHTNPSGLLTDSKVDFWHDTFLADTVYTQYDYFPPLPEEEYFFYSKLHYSELSSSESSYPSALDWIADDDHSIISSDYVAAQPVQESFWSESFVSNTSSSLSENSYISSLEVGEFYDPFLQYFDHGMN
ncbi:hypothetical protein Pfo_013930 [Paulownia fortunei]|nr:hypothetical protein Pfo_013930 [Paulownia fortunei]